MVDRMTFSAEHESAAHRFAAAMAEFDDVTVVAHNGVVTYISLSKGDFESVYVLIRGEWREARPIEI